MNTEFLLKLADLLDTIEPENFNMVAYSNGDLESYEPEHICGTVACSLGYGPLIEPPVESDYICEYDFHREFQYDRYSDRVTGMNVYSAGRQWCFAGIWARFDNTPKGAAARIRVLVASPDGMCEDVSWTAIRDLLDCHSDYNYTTLLEEYKKCLR